MILSPSNCSVKRLAGPDQRPLAGPLGARCLLAGPIIRWGRLAGRLCVGLLMCSCRSGDETDRYSNRRGPAPLESVRGGGVAMSELQEMVP